MAGKRETKTALVRPNPPDHLSPGAREEWARIIDERLAIGALTRADLVALAAYCQAFARWAQAEKAIAEMAKRNELTGGLVITAANGNVIANPLVAIANKAMADVVRYGAELGMTPDGGFLPIDMDASWDIEDELDAASRSGLN